MPRPQPGQAAGGPTPSAHLAPHGLSLPVQGGGHVHLLQVLQVGVEHEAHAALDAVRAVCGVRGVSRESGADPGAHLQGQGLPASTSMPPSKAAKNFSPSNISTVSEGSGPRYRSSSRRRVASTWGAPTGSEPTPAPGPTSPALPAPGPHLVAGQALEQDLFGVPAPLQRDEVHTVQPQPLPGLPRQAPHAGLGGVPEPVPGGAGVRRGCARRGGVGRGRSSRRGTDQEKRVTWKRAYRCVSSKATWAVMSSQVAAGGAR